MSARNEDADTEISNAASACFARPRPGPDGSPELILHDV